MEGVLYIVPTPIGNLEDITLRAIQTLRTVDLVLAEDTRTSGFLLKHLGIEKPLRSYHQHNEHKVVEEILERLRLGNNIALVSDAGTPGISDPGFLVVREAVKAGIPVQTLPGPTALVPALVNSALPCHEFSFYGFLPQKKGRQSKLKHLETENKTFVLYESPYRLVKLLTELKEHLGASRKACVCRELSKLHEETKRGNLEELSIYFGRKEVKGEIVVVVEGKTEHKSADDGLET